MTHTEYKKYSTSMKSHCPSMWKAIAELKGLASNPIVLHNMKHFAKLFEKQTIKMEHNNEQG